ncbi:MAG: hypothetical protein DWQ06_00865 [Calditrichaeota bacterium]|nr:MAG: hypothetical protein DWQ06_00865 [Calditrichota bacterium]
MQSQIFKILTIIFPMIFLGCSQKVLSQTYSTKLKENSTSIMEENITEKKINGVWTKQKKEVSIFGRNGKLVDKIHFKWKNGTWTKSGKTSFTYSNGNPTTKFYRSILTNGDLAESNKEVNFYDSKNRLIKTSTYFYLNIISDWVSEGETKVEYNAFGKVKSKNLEQVLDKNSKITSKEIYTYDSKKRLVKILTENFNHQKKLESKFEKKIKYNSKGKISVEEVWNSGLYFANEPFLEEKTEYFYNSKGKLTKKVSSRKVGNQLKESTREILK